MNPAEFVKARPTGITPEQCVDLYGRHDYVQLTVHEDAGLIWAVSQCRNCDVLYYQPRNKPQSEPLVQIKL